MDYQIIVVPTVNKVPIDPERRQHGKCQVPQRRKREDSFTHCSQIVLFGDGGSHTGEFLMHKKYTPAKIIIHIPPAPSANLEHI